MRKIATDTAIEHLHQNTKCPYCGYWFSEGFSNVSDALGVERPQAEQARHVTLCTGCLRLLRIVEGQLLAVPDDEIERMSKEDQAHLGNLRDFITLHRELKN